MDKKIELRVVNISNSQAQVPAFAMLLQEMDGERQLPIIIGPAEAQAITFKLNNIKPIRPLTHDLFNTTLTVFSISLLEVLIHKAQEGVFYSYAFFKQGEEVMRIDSRTSDAIALAVRMNAPIYIFESILDKECIIMDDSPEENAEKNKPESKSKSLTSKNIQSLKKELAKAVKEENYELASVLRDEIARRQ